MMTLACPGCRARYETGGALAAREFTCKACGKVSPLPGPGGIHRAALAAAGAPADAWCPKCSRGLRVPPEKLGGWLGCPSCALVFAAGPLASLVPPAPPAPPPPAPPRPVPPALPPSARPPTPAAALGHHRKTFAYAGAGVAVLLVLVLIVLAFRGKKPQPGEVLTPSEHALSGEQVFKRLIKVAVLIITPKGSGSGFVVDIEQRLIVTNYHVVDGGRTADVIFPQYDGSDKLITDAGRGVRRELAVRGEVIATDEAHDLALIRVARLADGTSAVPLAQVPAEPGSTVYSVGGSGAEDNLLWRLTKGTVRGRAQRRETQKSLRLDSMILETDAPVNPGDSGGPVMNDRGELVAVVAHYQTQQRQVSGNIDVEEVRKFLARNGVSR